MVRPLTLILVVAVSGCAASSSGFARPADLYNPPAEYRFHYDALYADLFYRCTPAEGGGVRVDGYAVSSTRTGMSLMNFEMHLDARDAKGNVVASRWSYGDPINADNVTPIAFVLSVPSAGDGVRYDLRYRFQVPEGNGNGMARRGAGVRLVSGGQLIFGTVEDACSDRHQRKTRPPGA